SYHNHDQNNSPFKTQDIDDEDPTLTSCGIGSWRPQWLQVFASPIYFTMNFAIVGVVQAMTGSFLVASISTLEKRYAFDSKISGYIFIADNFVQMLVSPIIGYLSNRFNRPRMIATGELILALSCFINAMPYFIYGPGTHLLHDDNLLTKLALNETRYEMCPANQNDIDCSGGKYSTVWGAVILLIIGSSARGLGYTAYSVIGMPYIDDSVQKTNSPLYISFLSSVRLIGSLLFIVTLPMFLFPKQFKTATVKVKDLKENVSGVKGFGGYLINKPKYIESQFRQSSSGASFITGATSVLPIAIGIILGGVIIKYIKPRPLTLVIYMFAIELVTNGALLFGMFTGCPSLNLPSTGLTPDNQFSLNSKCNTGCECTTRVFTPICAEDKMTTYFSPCFAGCNKLNRASGTVSGCSCIGDYEGGGGGEATTSFCQSDTDNCNNLMPYLIMMTVSSIILSTTGTGNVLLTLRALDPKDKSFAMGVMGTFMAIFAFIPYPLIFGAVVDSTCLVWESKCGKTGNCWIYDQDKFRYYLHGTALVFVCVGSLMDLGIIYNAKHIKNFYDDSYDTKVEKETTNGDNNNVIAMTGVTLKANDVETDGVI
ncbi:unnamed protein product, partial [Oppiella nova]